MNSITSAKRIIDAYQVIYIYLIIKFEEATMSNDGKKFRSAGEVSDGTGWGGRDQTRAGTVGTLH